MHVLHALFLAGLIGTGLIACQMSAPSINHESIFSEDQDVLADDSNIIVLVASQPAANMLIINATRRGYQLNEEIKLSGLDLILLDFERPEGVSGPLAISDMQSMERSATAGVDHLFYLQEQGSEARVPANPRVYADDLLDWPSNGCAANLSVGIIDGDVETTSTRLAGIEIVKMDFSGGSPAATDHGTAIADLLVGPGKLRNTKLYAATVVSEDMPQTGAGVRELILALDWMQASDVKLVNISLAGPYNALLDRAIRRATRSGMIIVAAVGNDGPEAEPRYPAAFGDVIAVTAVDRSLEVYSRAVRGEHIDFAAPGVDVFVSSVDQGKYLSGTSVAAPFITALIASNPVSSKRDRVGDIRKRISDSAIDIGPEGRDPIFGTGLPKRTWNCE